MHHCDSRRDLVGGLRAVGENALGGSNQDLRTMSLDPAGRKG